MDLGFEKEHERERESMRERASGLCLYWLGREEEGEEIKFMTNL